MKIRGTGGRTLHRRLLAMHVVASVNMGAGAAKYMLPPSDTSCRVSHRAWIASLLFYDVSAPQAVADGACLVLFLLAKTSVTNGNRTLTSWENGITWWSRFWAWIYLPVSGTVLGLSFPGEVNSEGTACFNSYGEETETREVGDVAGFAGNNVLLTVQYVLLLAMFIKPMLVSHGNTQSGGAVYRRVVIRNIVCTIGIACAYVITTVVVVLALLSSRPDTDKAAAVGDIVPSINICVTLCLTEVGDDNEFVIFPCISCIICDTGFAGSSLRYNPDPTQIGRETPPLSFQSPQLPQQKR
ncbi:unnamed protein product [Ectocarpus sp. CCAP 1310/34]|nr:unnamed protein product [Ectocarpus sp. CCAP 1310/34]